MLTREEQRRRLRAKSELLWRLVTTTPGVTDLAEPMKRVERFFERLTKAQRTTIAVIAQQLTEGYHAIDGKEIEEIETKTVRAEILEPDAIIPPTQRNKDEDTGE